MIDTIVLLLDKDAFQITDPEKFNPSAKFISQNNFFSRCTQNPMKVELRNGIYKPHLTLFKQNINQEPILKIELSLPKLFFGNNFNELQYKNFDALITKLIKVLQQMGIEITFENLINAQISSIHYSKNIPLTDGSTPYHFINKIKSANIKMSLDVNQTDYRNEGHSYKWHCNAYEVVFYDKIKDLEKAKLSNKRTIEKCNDIQLNLFETLRPRKKKRIKPFEILRMEVRLNKRQKIKHLFKKLNIKADLTFKKLFKPNISKKILLHYLDEIESKRPNIIDYKVDDKTFLTELIINNLHLKPNKIFKIYGLKKILEIINIRELRQMFKNCNDVTWYRLMKDTENIKLPIKQFSFDVIRTCIMKGKPVRLS